MHECEISFARRMKLRPIGFVTVFAAAALLGACNNAPPAPPAATQGQVSGTVTNGGKPVTTGSNVVFFCKESAVTAAGKVDSLGKFSLTGADPKTGIPAGRYEVMIRPPEEPTTPVGTDDYKALMMQGGNAPAKPEKATDIPKQFHAFETSELVLEVKTGPNTFDLDLAKLAK